MQEPSFMEFLFGSDAYVRGTPVVLSAHIDEVCVNCHPKFEFLNESIVEHVIFWLVLTFCHLSCLYCKG